MKETGHKIDFKGVKILDREKRANKRYTLESLRIQQRIKKSINTKEDKDNTKLQYSIAITWQVKFCDISFKFACDILH